MSDFDQDEDDLDVEITDLDAPEATSKEKHERPLLLTRHTIKTFLLSPWLLRPRRPVSGRQLRIAGVTIVGFLLLVLLLSSSGLFTALPGGRDTPSSSLPARKAAPAQRAVQLTVDSTQVDNLSCLMDAVWSPDSQLIAVLGYSQGCPQLRNSSEPGLLNLYSGLTGKRVLQLRPDGEILTVLKQQLPLLRDVPVIAYQNVLWSPDGQRLAVVFSIYFPTDVSASSYDGVILFGPGNVQTPQVFLAQEPSTASVYYLTWDLQQGVASFVPTSVPPMFEVVSTVWPALAYRWLPGGNFAPAPGAVSMPIGNPDGGETFTPWQSGTLTRLTESGDKPFQLPGIYVWSTFFSAWSPDERYLATRISVLGRVTWPGQPVPSHQSLVALGATLLGTLPVHDRAFKALADSLPVTQDGSINLNIAWRPDGRVLATYNSGTVDLYDCATGKKLTSLIPNRGNPVGLNGVDTLRWSPDGAHLLLSSSTWGPLALWGPGQLPRVR